MRMGRCAGSGIRQRKGKGQRERKAHGSNKRETAIVPKLRAARGRRMGHAATNTRTIPLPSATIAEKSATRGPTMENGLVDEAIEEEWPQYLGDLEHLARLRRSERLVLGNPARASRTTSRQVSSIQSASIRGASTWTRSRAASSCSTRSARTQPGPATQPSVVQCDAPGIRGGVEHERDRRMTESTRNMKPVDLQQRIGRCVKSML